MLFRSGMIAPLTPFAIKGALWYQGAASWPFWLQYRRLLPALIADWRDQFQAGDFPFLIVSQSTQSYKQSHPIEAGYGEIRESQWRTARKVPNTCWSSAKSSQPGMPCGADFDTSLSKSSSTRRFRPATSRIRPLIALDALRRSASSSRAATSRPRA